MVLFHQLYVLPRTGLPAPATAAASRPRPHRPPRGLLLLLLRRAAPSCPSASRSEAVHATVATTIEPAALKTSPVAAAHPLQRLGATGGVPSPPPEAAPPDLLGLGGGADADASSTPPHPPRSGVPDLFPLLHSRRAPLPQSIWPAGDRGRPWPRVRVPHGSRPNVTFSNSLHNIQRSNEAKSIYMKIMYNFIPTYLVRYDDIVEQS